MLLNGFGPHLVTALRSLLTELLSPGSLADIAHRAGHRCRSSGRASDCRRHRRRCCWAMAVIAILANLAQVGFNFNPQRLSFNLAAPESDERIWKV